MKERLNGYEGFLNVERQYRLTREETPDTAEVRFVGEQLREYNRACVGDSQFEALSIFLRDEDNTIVGGILGGTYWGWLHIDVLWVREDLRHQGFGRSLLEAAEQEGLARGCRQAYLDTFGFQALGFYQKEGYTVFGELQDIPTRTGYSQYFLTKMLQPITQGEPGAA